MKNAVSLRRRSTRCSADDLRTPGRMPVTGGCHAKRLRNDQTPLVRRAGRADPRRQRFSPGLKGRLRGTAGTCIEDHHRRVGQARYPAEVAFKNDGIHGLAGELGLKACRRASLWRCLTCGSRGSGWHEPG
jgi:hypothetical protein